MNDGGEGLLRDMYRVIAVKLLDALFHYGAIMNLDVQYLLARLFFQCLQRCR